MSNNKNLISLGNRSPTERSEIASKGGKASGKAKRRKKDLRKILNTVLTSPVTDEEIKAELEALGVEDTQGGLMIFRAVQNAGKNPAMFRTVLELAGYTLTRQEVTQEIKTYDPNIMIYLPDNNRD